MNKFKIHCVRISTQHLFEGNLLEQQYQLRYNILVKKLKWTDVFVENDMEFDKYDNPSTEYLIAVDDTEKVVGTIRTHPTMIPYMLSEEFPFLVAKGPRSSQKLHELSRLVCDNGLSKTDRKIVTALLFAASVERGLQRDINAYVGFVDVNVKEDVFDRDQWNVLFSSVRYCLNPEEKEDKYKEYVVGVILPVNTATLEKMKHHLTSQGYIDGESLLDFGKGNSDKYTASSKYSDGTNNHRLSWLQKLRWRVYIQFIRTKNLIALKKGQCISHNDYLN